MKRDAETLNTHALRAALFETLVVSELVKRRFNAGQPSDLYFWRDNVGYEVDVLFELGSKLQAVEIKPGAALSPDWFAALSKWQSIAGEQALPPWLIYGGEDSHERQAVKVLGWKKLSELE